MTEPIATSNQAADVRVQSVRGHGVRNNPDSGTDPEQGITRPANLLCPKIARAMPEDKRAANCVRSFEAYCSLRPVVPESVPIAAANGSQSVPDRL